MRRLSGVSKVICIVNSARPYPIYTFYDVTSEDEVTAWVIKIHQDLGRERNSVKIYVMSGAYGDDHGNLVGECDFFSESSIGGLQTVIRVRVDERTPANTWSNYFNINFHNGDTIIAISHRVNSSQGNSVSYLGDQVITWIEFIQRFD